MIDILKNSWKIIDGALILCSSATHAAPALSDLYPISMLFVKLKKDVSHTSEVFASHKDMHLAIETISQCLK